MYVTESSGNSPHNQPPARENEHNPLDANNTLDGNNTLDRNRTFDQCAACSGSSTRQCDALEATAFPAIDGDAVILTGSTASGKSSVALEIAERIGAEIISIDSIAVYRGMDIGTAKPTPAERARVKHHLIDVACPTQPYSVAAYLASAWQAVEEIRDRGCIPLFVGGTPMYLKGLLHGFDPGPPADWEFRRAVESDLAQYGPEALHQRLWQVDPLSAHRLAPSDTRRITRALEVAYLTGRPLSHRQSQFERPAAHSSGRAFVIHWPRPILHRRIEARVKTMFETGLVDEVQRLLETHKSLSRTASIAVGYREVIAMLAGELERQTAINEVVAHTRQLARRQETWLRSLAGLGVLEVADETDLDKLPPLILQQLNAG
jgi:tRNA dimethylallyltransferase